ncbi:MAG: hypothetical protein ACE5I5_10320 [Candidatus Heimdallarchaeota archaeon]
MNPNSTELDHQDIIIQEPDPLMVSLTGDQISLLKNPRYLNLVKVIHEKGPMTLADMAEEYAILAKDDEAKSESTVYRILNELKQSNIVQEAGKRLIERKPLSQTLYSLTTKYIILDEEEIDWEGSDGQRIFQEIVKILQILNPDKSIDDKALFQWQLQFQHQVDTDKQKLINSNNPQILEMLSVWAPTRINNIVEALGWLSVLIKDPNAQQDYLNCFSDASEGETVSLSTKVDTLKRSTKGAYRDVINQYPEIKCEIMEDNPRRQYFDKPAYRPLFHVLKDGPLTIKELVSKYNEVAPVQRTPSTISRYVKTLKEVNLLIEVGIRVTQGKIATQKLYGPIARMIALDKTCDTWDDERCDQLLDTLIQLFQFLYPDLPKADKECLRNFHIASYEYVKIAFSKFSEPENENIRKLLHSYNWQDFFVALTGFLDHQIFLNMPNMREQLLKCFSE